MSDVALMMYARFMRIAAIGAGASAIWAPATHAASPICGPARASTVTASADVRVYVRSGELKACDRRGGPVRSLGARSRALGVWVAGPRIAVRRARGTGERLSVYTPRALARTYHKDVTGSIEAVALERRGVAVLVERAPDGQTRVRVTRGPLSFAAPGFIPGSLRFRGGVAAWRDRTGLNLFALLNGTRRAETLARFDTLELTVRGGVLRYRRAGTATVELAEVLAECTSSQGCSGIDRVQVSGRFLAARTSGYGPDGSRAEVEVYDLKSGRHRAACPSGAFGDFTLARDGAVACG